MSVQTGSLPPPGPASARFVDRARFRVRLWESQPNPLWIRELRQAARLSRTPVILTVVAVLTILVIASLGAIVSADASPATTGVVIFQVFFSIAYFVVTLVGPAVAANSIASEREGRTWEAVLLTGLPPVVIAIWGRNSPRRLGNFVHGECLGDTTNGQPARHGLDPVRFEQLGCLRMGDDRAGRKDRARYRETLHA